MIKLSRLHTARRTSGFTLVELLGTITLMAILAVVAAPSVTSLSDLRESGLKGELHRRLVLARSFAMATGDPVGVRIDANAGVIESLEIPFPGFPPQTMTDANSADDVELVIASQYPGVTITRFINGALGGDQTVIWFDRFGSPQVRDADGLNAAPFTSDAEVEVEGAGVIRIYRLSGLIE